MPSSSIPLSIEQFTIQHVPANPEPFSLLNRIPIRECGDPLVDLRERLPGLRYGDKCLPFVRSRVAEMLDEARSFLPGGVTFKVLSALRTLEMQADMYWSSYERVRQEHPHWPVSTLRRYCNKRWAPPDAKAPPGHCTGAAVDVKLCDVATGEDVDLSSPYDDWWKSAPTAVRGLTETAQANRRLLCYAMHAAGFSNCRDEFWHWSYGDSAWAARIGAGAAIYGLVRPPVGAEPVALPKQEHPD